MNQFSRRQFLKTGGIALAGTSFALNQLSAIAERYATVKHLGVQLWSVREDMKKDARGTIEAIAKMGYKEVEPFGYDPATSQIFGMHHSEFDKLLKDNGLAAPSSHFGFNLDSYDAGKKELTDMAKKAINTAANAGQKYIICPYIVEEQRPKMPELVKMLNAAGQYAKQAGIKLGYHNHDFEFKISLDGRLMYEWILQEVDPKLLVMEMDIYWVNFAWQDPLDWFKKYPGRFQLCHVKDLAKTEKRETIEVGDGVIPFADIFKQRQKAGFRYYIIELENYVTTPLKGIEKGRDYFVNKLKF